MLPKGTVFMRITEPINPHVAERKRGFQLISSQIYGILSNINTLIEATYWNYNETIINL